MIAARLPGASQGTGKQFSFDIDIKGKRKGFVWAWLERTGPKKARTPNDAVLAVRVPSLTSKDLLIASDGDKFFTEPHYNGYPAVLVRLEAIGIDELEDLIVEAWRCIAPAALQKELGGDRERQ